MGCKVNLAHGSIDAKTGLRCHDKQKCLDNMIVRSRTFATGIRSLQRRMYMTSTGRRRASVYSSLTERHVQDMHDAPAAIEAKVRVLVARRVPVLSHGQAIHLLLVADALIEEQPIHRHWALEMLLYPSGITAHVLRIKDIECVIDVCSAAFQK
eukprot:6206034-Pleurochrysis_carterae.AAC.1